MERATLNDTTRGRNLMTQEIAAAMAAMKAGVLTCSRAHCRSKAVLVRRTTADPIALCAMHGRDDRLDRQIRDQRDERRRRGSGR